MRSRRPPLWPDAAAPLLVCEGPVVSQARPDPPWTARTPQRRSTKVAEGRQGRSVSPRGGLDRTPCGWQRDPRPRAGGGRAQRRLSWLERMSADALGRSQGGFRTKMHLRAEGGGKPLTILITAGQRHEQTVFEPLMVTGAIKRGAGAAHARVPNAWPGTGATAARMSGTICAGAASGWSFRAAGTSGAGVPSITPPTASAMWPNGSSIA